MAQFEKGFNDQLIIYRLILERNDHIQNIK